jgi:hypothetical protein
MSVPIQMFIGVKKQKITNHPIIFVVGKTSGET